MACLGHLALAAPVSGEPLAVGRRLAEEAVAIAEANGWDTHRNAAPSFAAAGTTLAWLGRFPEAERCLDRAERALAPGGAPEIELLVNKGRGLVRLGQGRLDDALAAFRAAERMEGALGSEHPLMLDLSSRKLRTQIELGETAAVRAALAGLPPQARGRAEMRIAAAAAELAEGAPSRRSTSWSPSSSARRGLPSRHDDRGAAARRGGARAARRPRRRGRLARARARARRAGWHPPAVRARRRQRAARAPRRAPHRPFLAARHGPRHAGRRLTRARARAAQRPAQRRRAARAALPPSNLKATEIAAELCVSSNTVRTHLRHVYAKLDAHSRSEAVSRARLLGLLAPAGLDASRCSVVVADAANAQAPERERGREWQDDGEQPKAIWLSMWSTIQPKFMPKKPVMNVSGTKMVATTLTT